MLQAWSRRYHLAMLVDGPPRLVVPGGAGPRWLWLSPSTVTVNLNLELQLDARPPASPSDVGITAVRGYS